jgi:hypothetical protein
MPLQSLPDLGSVLDGSISPLLLIAGIGGTILLMFVAGAVYDQSVEDAAERTSRSAAGATTGAIGVAVAVAAEGLQVLSEAPGIVLGALGVGGVALGASVKMMAASAFVALVVLRSVRG